MHTTPAIAAIKEQGRSIAWIARELGISRSHLYRKLAGERALTEDEARQIQRLTGLPSSLFRALVEPNHWPSGVIVVGGDRPIGEQT